MSLRRSAGLMRWHTTKVVVKINPAIALLSELCNYRLPKVLNNLCGSTGMLNVDEGIVLIDSKSKNLLKQSVLQIQNARFIPAFFIGNVRSASNARPTFNARPAFCLPQNARPVFC